MNINIHMALITDTQLPYLMLVVMTLSVIVGYLLPRPKRKPTLKLPLKVRLNHYIARSVLRRFMFSPYHEYHRFSAGGRHGVIAADSMGEARNIACNLLLHHGYTIWGPEKIIQIQDFTDPPLENHGMVAVIGIHKDLDNVYVDEEDED